MARVSERTQEVEASGVTNLCTKPQASTEVPALFNSLPDYGCVGEAAGGGSSTPPAAGCPAGIVFVVVGVYEAAIGFAEANRADALTAERACFHWPQGVEAVARVPFAETTNVAG